MLIAILLLIVTSMRAAVVMLVTMARELSVKHVPQEHGPLVSARRILRPVLTVAQGPGLPFKVPIRRLPALNVMKERGQL